MSYTKTPVDITGQRFGRLVAQRNVGKTCNSHQLWECVCDCGAMTVVRKCALMTGGTKSCGCLRQETMKSRKSSRGIFRKSAEETCTHSHYSTVQVNARRYNLEFQLDKDTFRQLTSSNCHYCGSAPTRAFPNSRAKHEIYLANGIDRVDCTAGYTVDNCVPSCSICNFMKRALRYEGFLEHVQKIYNHSIANALIPQIKGKDERYEREGIS